MEMSMSVPRICSGCRSKPAGNERVWPIADAIEMLVRGNGIRPIRESRAQGIL
jgi:hypothetical protein